MNSSNRSFQWIHCKADFIARYMRALAAMYIRMTFHAVEVYEILEPLLKDYRKLRMLDMSMCRSSLAELLIFTHNTVIFAGGYSLTFMDEFVHALLTEDRVCDIILPRIAKREILEENGEIGPRKSRLLDALEGKDEQEERGRNRSGSEGEGSVRSVRSDQGGRKSVSVSRSRSRSGTPSEAGSRYVSRSPSRSRSNSPLSPRNHSISPKRMDTD
jgi:pre-mRNA-splicing factor 38A